MGQRDELKTQFMTREGLYKLMTLSEYSRPNRFVRWGCTELFERIEYRVIGGRLQFGCKFGLLCVSTRLLILKARVRKYRKKN